MTLAEVIVVDRGTDRLAVDMYPDPAAGAPVVVLLPAMGVPAGYYRPFVAELGAAGLGAAVVDLRGTGASTPPAGRAARYGMAELVEDVDAVFAALARRLDGRRVVLLGHSLGGQIAALHLARAAAQGASSPAAGLALVACGLPYYRVYPGRERLAVLAFTQGIGSLAGLIGYWPGTGFGGRQARGVMRDWAYTGRHGRFPAGELAELEAALGRVTTPVLAVSVARDQYTPPATTDHLCAKLTAAPVTRHHYTRTEAGGTLDHFKWTRAGGRLAARLATFTAGLPATP